MKKDNDQRPSWARHGLRFVGNWEPLAFRRRQGFVTTDEEENYRQEHSEAFVKKLASLGVNFWSAHFFKGFGIGFEKDEMARASALLKLCRKHGMKTAVYIQGGSLFTETFFDEEPEAINWVQRDKNGQPITYGHQQSWRYTPCRNHPGFIAFLKKVIDLAVSQADPDAIFIDNFGQTTVGCFCQSCRKGFTEFLKQKYDTAGASGRRKAEERFGHTAIAKIEIPYGNQSIFTNVFGVVHNPAIQEWLEFRCKSFNRVQRELSRYMKRLKPDLGVFFHLPFGLDIPLPFYGGFNVCAHRAEIENDVTFLEERNWPRLSDDGVLVSRIRSYKMAHRVGCAMIGDRNSDLSEEHQKLYLAESMAFSNANFMMLGRETIRPLYLMRNMIAEFSPGSGLARYVEFSRKYEAYFRTTKSLAPVAILRSYPSLTYNWRTVYLATVLCEQVCIQYKIPFDIIFESDLLNLARYRAIVLPDTECLSDDQLDALKKFVKNGGGLVATGATGCYDHWRRRRLAEGFPQLFTCGQEGRGQYGQGRFVYLPAIIPAKPYAAPAGGVAAISNEYWLLPKNAKQLVQAVQWAADNRIMVHVKAPLTTVLALYDDEEMNRVILHLVNYDTKRRAPAIRVEIEADYGSLAGKSVTSVTLMSPDGTRPEGTLAFRKSRQGYAFTVPGLARYCFVVLSVSGGPARTLRRKGARSGR